VEQYNRKIIQAMNFVNYKMQSKHVKQIASSYGETEISIMNM